MTPGWAAVIGRLRNSPELHSEEGRGPEDATRRCDVGGARRGSWPMFTILRRIFPSRALTPIVVAGALLVPASAAVAAGGNDVTASVRRPALPESPDPWCVAVLTSTQRAAAMCCWCVAAPPFILRGEARSPNVTARVHPLTAAAPLASAGDVVVKWSAIGFMTTGLNVPARCASTAVRIVKLEFAPPPSARAPPRKTSARGAAC